MIAAGSEASETSHRRRREAGVLFAAAGLAAPVLLGIVYSVAASVGLVGAGATGHASMARVAHVLSEHVTWASLLWTLGVSAVATTLATAGAVMVAVMFRDNTTMHRTGRLLAALPLPIPHVVAGALGVWILSQSGTLARAAFALGVIAQPADMPALVYDRFGAGLALTLAWKEMAFLGVVATALLVTRGAAAEEAARTLGASARDAFRRVTWPLLWRGLAPAVVAVFVFVTGNYEVAALLAPSNPPALALLVAERAADADLSRRADAYVASLLLLGVAVAAVAVHEWARARWEPLSR